MSTHTTQDPTNGKDTKTDKPKLRTWEGYVNDKFKRRTHQIPVVQSLINKKGTYHDEWEKYKADANLKENKILTTVLTKVKDSVRDTPETKAMRAYLGNLKEEKRQEDRDNQARN